MFAPLGLVWSGCQNIKAHKWFTGFSWSHMESMSIEPPYVPGLEASEPVPTTLSCTGERSSGQTRALPESRCQLRRSTSARTICRRRSRTQIQRRDGMRISRPANKLASMREQTMFSWSGGNESGRACFCRDPIRLLRLQVMTFRRLWWVLVVHAFMHTYIHTYVHVCMNPYYAPMEPPYRCPTV